MKTSRILTVAIAAAAVLAVVATSTVCASSTVWWNQNTADSSVNTASGSPATWTGQVSGIPNAAAGDTLKWKNYFDNNRGYSIPIEADGVVQQGGLYETTGTAPKNTNKELDASAIAASGWGGYNLQVGVCHWYENSYVASTRGQTYHSTSS